MPTFQKLGKPDTNLLEEYVFDKPKTDKRADRIARSQKARQHRAEVKAIRQRRATKDRSKKD